MQIILDELKRSMGAVPLSQVPMLLGVLGAITAEAQLRLIMGDSAPAPLPDAGRYLSAKEVADRFGVKKVWLYRHKRQMPHSQPSRKVLNFPEQAITRWFASRKGT
jgi:predicted DNA-binding transcriptional regulator AlpA